MSRIWIQWFEILTDSESCDTHENSTEIIVIEKLSSWFYREKNSYHDFNSMKTDEVSPENHFYSRIDLFIEKKIKKRVGVSLIEKNMISFTYAFTGLSNRLRHLNRSCYNVCTDSNNSCGSQSESQRQMQTSLSASIGGDDVITTSNLIGRTSDPMESPSSPTSVITQSLNHFDVDISESKTTPLNKASAEVGKKSLYFL